MDEKCAPVELDDRHARVVARTAQRDGVPNQPQRVRYEDKSVAALREQDVGDDRAMLRHLDDLSRAGIEAVSPVERIEHVLHSAWPHFRVA